MGKGAPKAVRVDVNYKNKTHLDSLKQARNRMDGRRRGIYDMECCTDGLEGKKWTDGQEECRQSTEREELHLNSLQL